MGRSKQAIDEKKLSRWKLLEEFRRRFAKVMESAEPKQKPPGGPERLLLQENYFSLMLFGLFNPIEDTMRGLCAASHLERVQKEVCSRKVSLGSFSEARGVFDPEPLRQVFLDLSGEIPVSWGDARLRHLADKLNLVDGTLSATDLDLESELIARRRGHPDLQRAHRGTHAATSNGQAPRQTGHGADPLLHDGPRAAR